MAGIIGKKVGMTSVFDQDGKNLPCTVIEAGPCVVTQVKVPEVDGYSALQLAYDDKKEKRTSKAMLQHFAKASCAPKRKIVEFEQFKGKDGKDFSLGDLVTMDVFQEGSFIDVEGLSKGKGFQGPVRRHHFRGVGSATHGQHNRLRAPGSMGASSYPSRVFKGKKLGGRMGGDKVTMLNLKVIKLVPEHNLIIVKGSVPGAKGSYVIIEN